MLVRSHTHTVASGGGSRQPAAQWGLRALRLPGWLVGTGRWESSQAAAVEEGGEAREAGLLVSLLL